MTVKGIIGDADYPLSKTEEYGLKIAGHEDGEICCQRFFNNKLESGIFKSNMLVKKAEN